MLNGSPHLFQASRGLRQGDPVSISFYLGVFFFFFFGKILFTLVLGALLSKATELDLIKGFDVACNGEAVTQPQFADDTFLFSSSSWEEIVMLKRMLRCFQLVSSSKVNLS